MPRLPRPGEWVQWRDPRHASTHWWDETFGPGPFEVVCVVDHTLDDAPHGIILKTNLGEREVNEVWLAFAKTSPPTGAE